MNDSTKRGSVARVCKSLSLSDRDIARELGISVASLRSLDRAACPRYLRLAVAALVVGLDEEAVLESNDSSISTLADTLSSLRAN